MKAQQLRTIATTLNATVTDRRRITALVAGIRNYSATITAGTETSAIAKLQSAIALAVTFNADQAFIGQLRGQLRAIKAILKAQTPKVTFDGFQPPYSW